MVHSFDIVSLGVVWPTRQDLQEKFLSDYREIATSQIAKYKPTNLVFLAATGAGKTSSSFLGPLAWISFDARDEYRNLASFKTKYRDLASFKTKYQDFSHSSQWHEIAHLILQSSDEAKASNVSSEFSEYHTIVHSILQSSDEIEVIAIGISGGGILFANIEKKLKEVKRNFRYIRKLISLIIRLQYIARETHNRVSESPTPIKKEPPIGGIKVGGEQHAFCHAA